MSLKKVMILSCVSLGLLVSQANASSIKVGIATEAYPPFSVPNAEGNYTGWEIDIANAICEQAKLDCEIVRLSPHLGTVLSLL
ncbi:transporter substrate-binding domain-containing protein [Vibrio algarum]|uniref:Transporter substrate-binding domain-containing protein n=1 Tax=Vibrio algarum TaxID=3020714 RepID=A0ABT4YPK8_9VIBR|nr:transporter substrate-binding domain-containing protein [Vibrio sp. KJ40-1]MDB1123487.1 transporter substrate-binding domain-containing protein [Vibrio sp. KJ40-1]